MILRFMVRRRGDRLLVSTSRPAEPRWRSPWLRSASHDWRAFCSENRYDGCGVAGQTGDGDRHRTRHHGLQTNRKGWP